MQRRSGLVVWAIFARYGARGFLIGARVIWCGRMMAGRFFASLKNDPMALGVATGFLGCAM